jgi:hypothetical protein
VSAWPHGDPDAVVKAIVAQPAYHAAPAPATSGFLRFWYEFWDLVDRLLRPFWTWLGHALTNTRGVSPLAWVLIGLTVLATVVLIVRIVLGFVTPAIAARRTSLGGGGLDERRSADEWQRIAAGAAAAGEYARASGCSCRSIRRARRVSIAGWCATRATRPTRPSACSPIVSFVPCTPLVRRSGPTTMWRSERS